MAPWLNLLYHRWRREVADPSDKESGGVLENAERSLIDVAEGTEEFDKWFDEYVEDSPFILAIPGSSRKVHFVHSA
jgi:hypothetical protein